MTEWLPKNGPADPTLRVRSRHDCIKGESESESKESEKGKENGLKKTGAEEVKMFRYTTDDYTFGVCMEYPWYQESDSSLGQGEKKMMTLRKSEGTHPPALTIWTDGQTKRSSQGVSMFSTSA